MATLHDGATLWRNISYSVNGTTTELSKALAEAVTAPNPLTWSIIFSLIGLTLLSTRVREAKDLKTNNSGWFQFSDFFYRVQPAGLHWVSALPYLMNFIPTLSVFLGMYLGGWYTWLTAFAGYVIVPLCDLVVGEDSYNPSKEQENYLKKNIWFRIISWLYPPLYIFSVLFNAHYIHKHAELDYTEIAGITVSTAIAGGFGIGCIHELIHRPTNFELGLARVSLIFANYGHFFIEHLWGHHKRVATDEDPASSAVGDNVYTFLIRCWMGVARSAWDIERRFLKNQDTSQFNLFHNRIIHAWAASVLVGTAIYHYLGLAAFLFYIGQSVGVWIHIDTANFIEHYGLRRRSTGKTDSDGEKEYERPGWFHAWNTADRLSNYILFKIQRHPEHHVNAGRPYQILRHFRESPTMPTGYAGMFVLAWLPPLWSIVMDPLVENAIKGLHEYEKNKNRDQDYAFPKGYNNISSVYKREGEGFYEAGSSPYDVNDGFYNSDASAPRKVWGEKFDQNSIETKLKQKEE